MLRTTPKYVNIAESGVYVFESRHGPGFSMEMGKWDFDKICFVRRGKGTLVTKTKSLPISENDFLYLPANQPHHFSDDAGAPLTLVIVCYYPVVFSKLPLVGQTITKFATTFPVTATLNSARTHRRGALLSGMRRMIFEQTTGRTGSDSIILGLFIQLIVMLTRTAEEFKNRDDLTPSDQLFAKSLDFLEERFTDPIQIKDLAAMSQVSYRHYTALFRERMGVPVNSYLTRLRIEYAKKRLSETGNILFSSLESGFADLSHFYRVFKKETGQTPKQYILETAEP